MVERKKGFGLLDPGEFQPWCQKLGFTGQPARMLWVECDPLQIVSNTQTHQVVAGALLAGQSITICIAQRPGSGQVFVGNALMRGVSVGLHAVQDLPDRFQSRDNASWLASSVMRHAASQDAIRHVPPASFW